MCGLKAHSGTKDNEAVWPKQMVAIDNAQGDPLVAVVGMVEAVPPDEMKRRLRLFQEPFPQELVTLYTPGFCPFAGVPHRPDDHGNLRRRADCHIQSTPQPEVVVVVSLTKCDENAAHVSFQVRSFDRPDQTPQFGEECYDGG
jgi:hypothetical protein